MPWLKIHSLFASAVVLLTATGLSTPVLAMDVILDLTSIAQSDAKTAPPPPKQPLLKSVEMHPDDVLIVKCPAKAFPGAKGWIEYHARLSGPGCLISTMRTEPHAEAFQATGPGLQKILVGLKEAGASEVEKDCLVSVKVTLPVATEENRSKSANVQSYAGQTVFGNKTSATSGLNSQAQGFSSGSERNQAKQAAHSVEEQSKSTVKTYNGSSF